MQAGVSFFLVSAGMLHAMLLGCAATPPQTGPGGNCVREIVPTSSGTIEYTLQGTGPVILRLTGMSEDCEASMGNEALLAAGYSILTPSRPGYGKTPASVGGTAAEAADAMAALLDALGIVRVAVIAVSGGGPTAIHLAARHPDKVGNLVLEEAVSRYPRELDPERFETQKKFYGPGYGATLLMLKAVATISPRAMARQTMALFGTHDPDEAVKAMDKRDLERIRRFYLSQRPSWAAGASLDMEHRTGDAVLELDTRSHSHRTQPGRQGRAIRGGRVLPCEHPRIGALGGAFLESLHLHRARGRSGRREGCRVPEAEHAVKLRAPFQEMAASSGGGRPASR